MAPLHLVLISLWWIFCINGATGNDLLPRCTGPDRLKRADCVCDLDEIISFLSQSLQMGASNRRDPSEIVKQRIQAFVCQVKVVQLPTTLTIQVTDVNYLAFPATHRRKKVRKYRIKRAHDLSRHRQKRQISLGYPSQAAWEKAIPHMPTHSGHIYAPVGSPATLKCFGSEDALIIEQFDGTSKAFDWKFSNGLEVTGRLIQWDPITGDLIFQSVQLADTGIYNCTVTGKSQNDEQESNTFQVQLDVVAAPLFWLQFGTAYKVLRCRHEELLAIQRNIPGLVEKYVCSFCTVRNVTIDCVNVGDNERVVQLALALSAIGIEQKLPLWMSNHMNCNFECLQYMHQKILNVSSLSISKLFAVPINVLPISGDVSVYRPVHGRMEFQLADSCPPGFFLQDSLCFPCPPGMFSSVGEVFCEPCARGKFQPNPGSSACYRCPADHTTLKRGSVSQMACVYETVSTAVGFFEKFWYLLMIGGIVLAIIVIIFIIVCCCPHTKIGKLLRCVPCCGEKDCCKGDTEISEDTQVLINGTETTEVSSEAENTLREKKKAAKRRKRRQTKEKEESSDDYRIGKTTIRNPLKGLFTKIKKNASNKADVNDSSDESRTDFDMYKGQSSSTSFTRSPPTPPPPPPPQLNTKKHCVRTAKPYNFNCPETAYNRYNQDQEEQKETQDRSKHFYQNDHAPHVRAGNILNTSESLTAKLAVQRRKLGLGRSKRQESPVNPNPPESRLDNRVRKSTEKRSVSRNVSIRESRNVYHDKNANKATTPPRSKTRRSKDHRGQNVVVAKSSSNLHNLRAKSTGGVQSVMSTVQKKLDEPPKRSQKARPSISKLNSKKRTRR